MFSLFPGLVCYITSSTYAQIRSVHWLVLLVEQSGKLVTYLGSVTSFSQKDLGALIQTGRNYYFCMNYGLSRCGTVQKDTAVPKAPTKFAISSTGGLVRAQFDFIPV